MSFVYAGYLALVLLGAWGIIRWGNIRFSPREWKAVFISIPVVAFLFTVWDILAVKRGHWSFGLEHTLGVGILNQPMEEIFFFVIIPFFGVVVYHYFKGGKIE